MASSFQLLVFDLFHTSWLYTTNLQCEYSPHYSLDTDVFLSWNFLGFLKALPTSSVISALLMPSIQHKLIWCGCTEVPTTAGCSEKSQHNTSSSAQHSSCWGVEWSEPRGWDIYGTMHR